MICYNFLNNRNLDLCFVILRTECNWSYAIDFKTFFLTTSLKTNQLWGNFENILFNIGESCFAYMTWFFMWSYITKYQWFANRQVKVGLSLHKFHCQLSFASALAFVSLWRPFVSLQWYSFAILISYTNLSPFSEHRSMILQLHKNLFLDLK